MLVALGLKSIWDRFSPWGRSKENLTHATFRQGVEQVMHEHDIIDARMVGAFFQVDDEFMDTLYSVGFRAADNSRYDFNHVAVFVADIKTVSKEQKLTEGSSIAFIATQNSKGHVSLLNISNYARSNSLDVVNSYTARKSANSFRNLLNSFGTEVASEYVGMYQAPSDKSHVASAQKVVKQEHTFDAI